MQLRSNALRENALGVPATLPYQCAAFRKRPPRRYTSGILGTYTRLTTSAMKGAYMAGD